MTTIALLLAALIVLLLAGLLVVDRWRPEAVPHRPERPAPPRSLPAAPAQVSVAPTPVPPAGLADPPAPPPPPLPAPAPVEKRRPVRIRFHDARTGEVVREFDESFALSKHLGEDGRFVHSGGNGRPLVPDADGWIGWFLGPGWESKPDQCAAEFAVDGYEKRILRYSEFADATEITLEPWTARVRGVLNRQGGGSDKVYSYVLAETVGEAGWPYRPRGLPTSAGHFEIHDLPDGKYEFRAGAMEKGAPVFARRAFEVAGGPVDLGEIPFLPAVTLRARVVDGAGVPRGESTVKVAEERKGVPLLSSDAILEFTPWEGRRVENPPAGGGWFLFDSLPPGARVKVLDLALPGAERTVTLPESGEADPVEIRWDGRIVKCRLVFTVGGKAPDRWLWLQSPGIPESSFTSAPFTGRLGEGTLVMDLAEGPHPVHAAVLIAGGRTPRSFTGTIEVPPRESYEATVDLSPADEGATR